MRDGGLAEPIVTPIGDRSNIHHSGVPQDQIQHQVSENDSHTQQEAQNFFVEANDQAQQSVSQGIGEAVTNNQDSLNQDIPLADSNPIISPSGSEDHVLNSSRNRQDSEDSRVAVGSVRATESRPSPRGSIGASLGSTGTAAVIDHNECHDPEETEQEQRHQQQLASTSVSNGDGVESASKGSNTQDDYRAESEEGSTAEGGYEVRTRLDFTVGVFCYGIETVFVDNETFISKLNPRSYFQRFKIPAETSTTRRSCGDKEGGDSAPGNVTFIQLGKEKPNKNAEHTDKRQDATTAASTRKNGKKGNENGEERETAINPRCGLDHNDYDSFIIKNHCGYWGRGGHYEHETCLECHGKVTAVNGNGFRVCVEFDKGCGGIWCGKMECFGRTTAMKYFLERDRTRGKRNPRRGQSKRGDVR